MPRITGTPGEHRAAMRDRILAAVRDVALAEGVDKLSVAEVALRAGLGRSVVYNYFADTRALLIAYAEAEALRFIGELRAALETAPTPTDALVVYVARQLGDFAAYPQPAGPELATLLGAEGYRQMQAHVQPLADLLVGIIEDGVAAGEFAPCDPVATATYVNACLGAERFPLGQGTQDLAVATSRVTAFVLHGLGVQP